MNFDELTTETEMREHLLADGNLRVPASRYGSDTVNCAEVAIVVERVLSAETGEPTTAASLDYAMSMVVNDRDDVEELLRDYGPEHGIDPDDYIN